MKKLIIAAALLAPGGLIIVGGVIAYRYIRIRRARREVRAEMQRMGHPIPRQAVHA